MSKKLTTRVEDYSKWYNELVVKADLAENSAVRGCMVIKPYGYAIWEKMQAELDRIKDLAKSYADLEDAFGTEVAPKTLPKRSPTKIEPGDTPLPQRQPTPTPTPGKIDVPEPVIPQVKPQPLIKPGKVPTRSPTKIEPGDAPLPQRQADPKRGKINVPVPVVPKIKQQKIRNRNVVPVTVPPVSDTDTGVDLYGWMDNRGSYYDWDKPGVPLKENTNTASLSGDELEAMIRNSAKQRGMDPNVAVRVWRSEGGTSYQSNVPRDGQGSEDGRESSYGPFQLYTGGGLGNEYEEKYGVDLRDDNTPEGIQRQIDFALNKAVEKGWGPWKGAARVNIGPRDGLEQSFIPEPETISLDTTKLDPQQMATVFDTISQTAQDYAKKGYDYVAPIAKDLGKTTSDYLNKKWQNFKTDAMATGSGTDTAAIAGAGDTGELPNVTRPRSPGAPPKIKGGPIMDKAKELGTATLDKASELNKSTEIVDTLGQKWQDFKKSASDFVSQDAAKKRIQQATNEKAPPGDKYERMVKDIKKGYTKDGKLTDTERGTAYATAWKLYNKRKGKKS